MEIINYHLDEKLHLPKNYLSVFQDLSFAMFDIETTGLNPEYSQVILIGILYVQEERIAIRQLFCTHRNEEKILLETFQNEIKNFDMLLSYNGDTFDIPFLNKRFQYHHIPCKIESYKNFDLLRFVRKQKEILNLQDCKLKSVEKSLGIHRKDILSGKESVELYNLFENNRNSHLKKLILLHNYDDLYYFSKCLEILDKVNLEEFLPSIPIIISIDAEKKCYVTKWAIQNHALLVQGFYPPSTRNYNHREYGLGFHFKFHHKTQSFEATIPLYKGSLSTGLSCLYINLNDFSFCHQTKSKEYQVPDHLVILKEGKKEKKLEIWHFMISFLRYILSGF
ncbi:ribonuclease H-like domain-containing protein [Thermotalea metallivorans]|uniref:YprB ribonuclease H-like domain-containing protein n=1 Tax=Thermotalea metallivorans TaxID=520762 RepID=A0A140L101_9FIRM|nr:ribonuclease H-like domain-containing protein [Thermotalea metallivorans]KXG74226.1 hypothetical protein AN619_25440 [Thermotalea metallivorans]